MKVTGKTGVEMEALTAVSVACLTIYDMVKAVERGMKIEKIRLIEKRGGKSGIYRARLTRMALLPVAEAIEQILRGVEPLPAESVGLGRRARLRAGARPDRATHPAAGRPLRDGRLRGARRRCRQSPATLKVIGEVAAGHPFPKEISAGECARIFTGGVLPRGTDTV